MYGHPSQPDPWAEVQEIPPFHPDHQALDENPEGFIVGCLFVALPAFFLGAALGFMGAVWGWI